MCRIMLFLSMLICLSSNKVSGQSPAKGKYRAFRELYKLDMSEVREGKHLEAAKRYSIKEFMEYYAEAGTTDYSKKWGRSTIIQLYKDSSFTYFGRGANHYLMDFLRVKNEELKEINYSEFDGQDMREKFYEEVIPQADKQRVERKTRDNMIGSTDTDFKYDYNQETKLLKVICKWTVRGDFMRVISKTYTAQYDVNARQFVKNTE